MKKHILVNYLGRKGGGMVYAYEMTKGLLENGYKVSAIVPEGIENAELWRALPLHRLYFLKTYHSNVTFLLGSVRFFLREKRRIRKLFAADPVDCIYIPMIQPWSGFLNGIFPKARVITTLHDPRPHPGSGKVMNWLYRKTTEKSDEIVLLSAEFIGYTSETYHIPKEHIHVIPHGVFDYYADHVADTAVKQVDRSEYNFLFFGRITPYKGLDLLADAYAELYETNRNISLTVVGSGDFSPYRDKFPEEKNILVVNEYIPDDEVALYFRGKNILTVLPYTDATQSGVIPIAMMEDSLLIVTDTGALREQVGDGRYALISAPDAASLAKQMRRAMENAPELAQMKRDAKTYIQSLSWGALSKRLGQLAEEEKV